MAAGCDNFLLSGLKRCLTSIQLLVPVGAALLLGACATQVPLSKTTVESGSVNAPHVSSADQEALRTLIAQQDRLYRVAAPLLVNNPELCKGNARNLLGFTAKNKYSYPTDYADAAQQNFGLNDKLKITGVLSGSGAARVGVLRGDNLLAVEDKSMPQGQNAERQAAAMLGPLLSGRNNVKLALERNGASIAMNVPLTPACAFGVELGNADNVNAYADGRRVMVTRGMLNFTRSDEELAYVLAKEMAHNALAHAARQNMRATVGGVIDNLIRLHPDLSAMSGTAGIRATSQELDAAADMVGLYMAARAGYGLDNAAPFWLRLARQYPVTVLNGYTAIHPATDFRLAAIEKNIADIKAKQASGKPLLP
jgi:hypothetical protein